MSMNVLILDSVGSCVDTEGTTYPMKVDRTPDLNAGVHLLDTTDEWWANMSVEDCEELMNFIDDLEAEVVPGFSEWGMNRLQFVKENN